ncbi:MAG TPA: DoxX family protein [Burkholderiales bacterium]|nr:DoxX family protein [Burkholderiales bacterium]
MNHSALLVGRILLSLVFLVAGYRKLMAVAGSAGYFAKLGFPMPDVMVWVAIAIELGGGILLVLGWKARWAALLLALFTAIAAFAAHRFWEVDPAQYANQMNHFLKNLAIIGGMLFVAAVGPGALSVDGRRRS